MTTIERNSVTVRVPATTANIGTGYDVLGMALDVWCEITVTRAVTFSVEAFGEGAEKIPLDDSNYVVLGVKKAFELAGKPVPVCAYSVKSSIPFGAGMGSSSAGIVGGLMAGLILSGHKVPVQSSEILVQMSSEVEGHPDNVAPAIYGGCQIGGYADGRWFTERIPVPAGLQCIMLITDFQNNTHESRKVVPKMIPIEDVVHNMSRTALFTLAFSTNRLDLLKHCADDRLHQVQRSVNLPHLLPAMKAAMDAGAHVAFLSGSGPTICAMTSGRRGDPLAQCGTERCDSSVAKAMLEAARGVGLKNVRAFVSNPVETGAHIISCDPPISSEEMKFFPPLSAFQQL